MKKISHMWSLIIVLSLCGFSVAFPDGAFEQEVPEELASSECGDERDIIVTGDVSTGNNAAMGRACIVMCKKDLKEVCEGDIVIVSKIHHSSWYTTLGLAAGIIVEKSEKSEQQVLSFGEEHGIPVIVGASGATQKVSDGEIIALDPITKNVYHVADPEPEMISHQTRGTVFDSLTLQKKEDIPHQIATTHASYSSKKLASADVHCGEQQKIIQNAQGCKKRITKDLYFSHFNRFKQYALSVRSQYQWGKYFGVLETGAIAAGHDAFTRKCMHIGDVLLSIKDEKYFINVLKHNGEEFIDYIDDLLNECSKKPGDTAWASKVSHEKHVASVELPANIDIKKLMENPEEYKKIEHKVSKKEREKRVAAGIFALYWIENHLS